VTETWQPAVINKAVYVHVNDNDHVHVHVNVNVNDNVLRFTKELVVPSS
jgi:hypothetical protein